MNKKVFSIIWIEALCAFFIPFGAAIGTGMTAFGGWPGLWKFSIILVASLVAGMSGLKSLLSTSVSDAQDAADNDLSFLNPKPISAAIPAAEKQNEKQN